MLYVCVRDVMDIVFYSAWTSNNRFASKGNSQQAVELSGQSGLQFVVNLSIKQFLRRFSGSGSFSSG